jgi:hypothetical protein
MKTPDQIKDIAQRVQLTALNSYLVDGKEHFAYNQKPYFASHLAPLHFGSNDGHPQQEQEDHTIQSMTNIIYTKFYCKLQQKEKKAAKINVQISDPEFVKTLSEANLSTDGYDYGWMVYSFDSNGSPWASKNGAIKQLHTGTYVNDNPSKKGIAAVGDKVHVYRKKEDTKTQPAFYYANGNVPLPQDASFTRFYFNIKPEGATVLIQHLTSLLNYYQIPFSFKCLNNPKNYVRTDSAVLYLDKLNTPLVYILLGSFVDSLKEYLNNDIPLFALKLWDGIGFAEDPSNGDSFGMSRSRLIAKGLLESFKKGDENDTQRVKTVEDYLTQSGYDIPKFHINPHTHFEYNFA